MKAFAADQPDGITYAQKQVDNRNPEKVKMLKNEAFFIKHLSHVNIVSFRLFWKLEATNTNDKRHHLVTEPCCDGALRDWLAPKKKFHQQRSLSLDLTWKWMNQISSAVAYLHKSNIIHGDISTGNILVQSVTTPHLYLCDFGTSRRFGPEGSAKTAEAYTQWFRAPEVLVESGKQHRATDVWATACIFLQILWRSEIHSAKPDPLSKLFKNHNDPNFGGFPENKPITTSNKSVQRISLLIKRVCKPDRTLTQLLSEMLNVAVNDRIKMHEVVDILDKTWEYDFETLKYESDTSSSDTSSPERPKGLQATPQMMLEMKHYKAHLKAQLNAEYAQKIKELKNRHVRELVENSDREDDMDIGK